MILLLCYVSFQAIEEFFAKDTRYIVTCKNLSEQDKYSSSPRTPSSSVLSNVNTNKYVCLRVVHV